MGVASLGDGVMMMMMMKKKETEGERSERGRRREKRLSEARLGERVGERATGGALSR